MSADRGRDLSIEEAAVELGMAPTAVIRLLESGQLPSHLGPDGRRRRVAQADLQAHRDERFALRQQLVQEQRARRWSDPSNPGPDPADELQDQAQYRTAQETPYVPRHQAAPGDSIETR